MIRRLHTWWERRDRLIPPQEPVLSIPPWVVPNPWHADELTEQQLDAIFEHVSGGRDGT